MALTLAPPQATPERMPTTIGLPLRLGSVLESHLRRSVTPALAGAIDAIVEQMRKEVYEPLIYAPGVEDLRASFVRLYPRYWQQHVSASLLIGSALGNDPERIFALIVLGLNDAQRLFESRGRAVLREEPTTAALLGVHAIRRAARGVVRGAEDLQPMQVHHWLNYLIAYAMVSSAVLTGLTDEDAHSRLSNLAVLAGWSRDYALRSYELTKRLGFLPSTDLPGAVPTELDEEDKVLAEADLDTYVSRLDDPRLP